MAIRVLREKGVASRAIARQLGVSEGTVRYHGRRADAGAEDGRRSKPQRAAEVAGPIEAWHDAQKGQRRPLNVLDLYEYLCEGHGYGGSYKSVLRYVRRRWGQPPIRTYRRVETVPGAQSQTDWGEYPRVPIGHGDPALSLLVMLLSHSRRPAMIWSPCKSQPSWLHCHNESFRRLGGVPAVNRIDNVKTAISAGAGAWGVINPTYRAYARTVGFHVDACPPRSPEAKGKSEAKVKLSRRIVDPYRRRWESIEELQAHTDERVARWSERTICPATGLTIDESWRAELAHLRALSALPEPFDVAVQRRVSNDCMVHFENREYAVPFGLAAMQVEVRGCARTVQIFRAHELVREYPRHTPERVLIDPSCYEGPATSRALPPPPLGKMGRRLQEIWELPVAQRPVDLYAALAEVAR